MSTYQFKTAVPIKKCKNCPVHFFDSFGFICCPLLQGHHVMLEDKPKECPMILVTGEDHKIDKIWELIATTKSVQDYRTRTLHNLIHEIATVIDPQYVQVDYELYRGKAARKQREQEEELKGLLCDDCERPIEDGAHYVKMPDGEVLCETCFFDRAICFYDAKEMHRGFEDEDEDEE